MRLLDTDVLTDVLRRHAPAEFWLDSLTDSPSIPGLVVMELVNGCLNKDDLRRVLRLTALFSTVWPTEDDCQRALGYFTQFRLSHSLGLLDSLIAATALCLGATLCTFNVKHFAPISGLVLEQPYTR